MRLLSPDPDEERDLEGYVCTSSQLIGELTTVSTIRPMAGVSVLLL